MLQQLTRSGATYCDLSLCDFCFLIPDTFELAPTHDANGKLIKSHFGHK